MVWWKLSKPCKLLFAVPAALLLIFGALGCQASAAGMTTQTGPVALGSRWEVLEDAEGRLTTAEAMADTAAFHPLEGPLAEGFTTSTFWLRFPATLAGQGAGEVVLEITPTYLDEVDLLWEQADGLRERRSGDLRPRTARDIDNHNIVFFLPAAGEIRGHYLYLRIHSTSTVTARAVLWGRNAFLAATQHDALVLGILNGILVASIVWGLVQFAMVRTWLNLSYVGYVLALEFYYFCINGFAGQVLSVAVPEVADRATSLSVCLFFLSNLLLSAQVLKLRERSPIQFYLQAAVAVLAAAGAVLALLGHYHLIVAPLNAAIPVVVAGQMAVSLRWAWRGDRMAALYALSFGPLMVAVFAVSVRTLGLVDNTLGSERLGQAAGIAHIIVMSLALALRVRQAENERRLAEAQVLDMTSRAKADLEVRVNERTEALQCALREQRHFLSMASHEFRTPLAIIGASLEMVELPSSGPAERTGEIAKVRRALRRMKGLVDGCLTDEWLDSGGAALRAQPIALAKVLSDLHGEWAQIAAQSLILDLDQRSCRVVGDADLLAIAVSNLVDNACKYAPPKSRVTLLLRYRGDLAEIAVADEGPGVPTEERALIFERFYRSDFAMRHSGAGLGLSLVRRIADLHGGHVSFEPREPKGSLFRLVLPLPVVTSTKSEAS